MSGMVIAGNCYTKEARMEHILQIEAVMSWRIVVRIAIVVTDPVDSHSILCCQEARRA